MHIIAMAAPHSADGCFALAVVYAVLASGICWIAIRRRRTNPNAHRFIAWIPVSACVGSLAAVLAGPIALSSQSMPHWIGYNVEAAFIRSFLGAISAAFISSVIMHVIETRIQTTNSTTVHAFSIAAVLCITALFAIFIQSSYVGFFVLVHFTVLATTNIIYIRRYIQRSESDSDTIRVPAASTESPLPEA